MNGEVLFAIVASLISVLVAVGGFVRQWLRDKPDIAQAYKKMAEEQVAEIKELRACIDILEGKVKTLEKTVTEWQAGIELLINQVVARGGTPIWRPKKIEPEDPNSTKPRRTQKP